MGKSGLMERLQEKLEAEDLSNSTVERTTIDVRQLTDWYEDTTGDPLELTKLVSIDLREWRGYLHRRGAKPSTIHRKFASVRKAISLVAPGRLHELKWPRMPRQQKTSPSGLSRAERNALLRAAEQMTPRDCCVVHLLLHTGARASSLAKVQLSDIELGARSGSVTYRQAKGNKTYTVPLNVEVRDAIRKWIEERPQVKHDHLLCADRFPHGPISRWVIHNVVFRKLRKLLPGHVAERIKGPHSLRHDLARRLLDGNGGKKTPVPLPDVALILGHSDVRTTAAVYCRPSQADLKRALDQLVEDDDEE